MCRPSLCEKHLTFEQVVATGSTSRVFRGKYRGMAVAIKRMTPVAARGVVLQRSFLREVEILSAVKHQNIVQMVGAAEEPACVVMELCAGGSLFDLLHLSEVDIGWSQQLKMAADIADAMGYLHNMEPSIIHCDLKSLNCLLSVPVLSSGDVPLVKLADFGLSCPCEPNQKLTQGCGTIPWMAPEVALGTEYGPSADTFSYGMTLWEILSMEVPFEDLPAHHVGLLVVRGARPVIQEDDLPPECPAEMIALMTQCWDQVPSKRPCFKEVQTVLARVRAATM